MWIHSLCIFQFLWDKLHIHARGNLFHTGVSHCLPRCCCFCGVYSSSFHEDRHMGEMRDIGWDLMKQACTSISQVILYLWKDKPTRIICALTLPRRACYVLVSLAVIGIEEKLLIQVVLVLSTAVVSIQIGIWVCSRAVSSSGQS